MPVAGDERWEDVLKIFGIGALAADGATSTGLSIIDRSTVLNKDDPRWITVDRRFDTQTIWGPAAWRPSPGSDEFMVILKQESGAGWTQNLHVIVLKVDIKNLDTLGKSWDKIAANPDQLGYQSSGAFYPQSLQHVGWTVLHPSIEFLLTTLDELAKGNKETRGHESGFKGKAAEAFLTISEGLEHYVRETTTWLTEPEGYDARISGINDGKTQYAQAAYDFRNAIHVALDEWRKDPNRNPLTALNNILQGLTFRIGPARTGQGYGVDGHTGTYSQGGSFEGYQGVSNAQTVFMSGDGLAGEVDAFQDESWQAIDALAKARWHETVDKLDVAARNALSALATTFSIELKEQPDRYTPPPKSPLDGNAPPNPNDLPNVGGPPNLDGNGPGGVGVGVGSGIPGLGGGGSGVGSASGLGDNGGGKLPGLGSGSGLGSELGSGLGSDLGSGSGLGSGPGLETGVGPGFGLGTGIGLGSGRGAGSGLGGGLRSGLGVSSGLGSGGADDAHGDLAASPVTLPDDFAGGAVAGSDLGGGIKLANTDTGVAGSGDLGAAAGLTGEAASGASGTAGTPGYPFMPPMGGMGGGSGAQDKERERSTWLTEEEDVWGVDPDCSPAVIGRSEDAPAPATGPQAPTPGTQRRPGTTPTTPRRAHS